MSRVCAGVRLCPECSRKVGLAKRARAARIAAKPLPAAVAHHAKERSGQEARQDADHQRLVARVRRRDGDLCQLCPPGTPPERRAGTDLDPIDPHHLEMGPTKRKNERLQNMLCAHRTCHDAYHANEQAFVPAVSEWCAHHGYPLPNRKAFR